MPSNLDKLQGELKELINTGNQLSIAMRVECDEQAYREQFAQALKAVDAYRELIPSFGKLYQGWYSEAHAVIRQLLPDRLADFVAMYEKPRNRKSLSWGNYVIADYLQGLRGGPGDVEPRAAISEFDQQLNILRACERRLTSGLFEIQQLVQADLFDSELDAARELARHKFLRAAGAVAGVVLEKHLKQVCENHSVAITKKDPGISNLNDALKSNGTIDVPQWRAIQHLGDLRNLSDHGKQREPTADEIADLIAGVAKVTKNVF